ncbi:hypothetical protein A2Z23_00060 [Candidatus Curtissbacteria bacterium RBG_16_39_7]|uniref:DUF4399 domain-containing protein n=1 Tax=Candidatus Curtissbacteria bacterium RBG_16_39_7 TaxID=1797707 RepID=A0A1F5G1E6_9BACT|nr:MAG: hypothetical protein A2Z23_00060 [Candidatus Curtissbacteria bacterium RBG_16_39_7]
MKKKVSSLILSLVLTFTFMSLYSLVFAQAPSLTIESPKSGEVMNKDEALVRFKVENFAITDFRRNPQPVAGQGHLHFWIDEANPTAQNAIKHISKEPYLLTKLEPKGHTLIVELVGNDSASLKPPVKKTVQFTTTGTPKKEGVTQVTTLPTPTKTAGNQTAVGIIVVIVVLVIGAVVGGTVFYQRKLANGKKTEAKKTPDQEEE